MEGFRASVRDSHNNFVPRPEAGVVNILPERWVSLQGLCVFFCPPSQCLGAHWDSLGVGEPASLFSFLGR